ncbi:MAG: DUF1839 family protein [Beijerinckiaceae bacterium]
MDSISPADQNQDALVAADHAPLTSPEGWRPSRLHAFGRDWPETNCDLDYWIELVASRGLAPEAMLGFIAAQDFIVDQFSLLVPAKDDLERFYGVTIRPLALYGRFEDHFAAHVRSGGVVVIETDSFYLPDSRGVAYRRRHIQSAIAIAAIDPARRRADYFHNLGFWRLEGDDYDMTVHRPLHLQADEIIPPHAEVIRFEREPLGEAALRAAALERLAWRLSRRPAGDPVAAFAATFPAQLERLAGAGENAFHDWAFHNLRQLGAGFELFGDHLGWLDGGPRFRAARDACKQVSSLAKTLQFQVARAVLGGRTPKTAGLLEQIGAARQAALAGAEAGAANATR